MPELKSQCRSRYTYERPIFFLRAYSYNAHSDIMAVAVFVAGFYSDDCTLLSSEVRARAP